MERNSNNLIKMEENANYKKIDREVIISYLQGKKSVKVKDIIEKTVAEKLRVYPILFEMEQEGTIVVLNRSSYGAPDIVELSDEK